MRFIIISVPPEPLARDLRALQAQLCAESGAREALRYPPHITLRTGLVCPEEAAGEAVEDFREHASRLSSVELRSEGPVASSYRDSSGVERGFLGYRIERTPELLELHRGLLAFEPWRKGPQGAYEPHVSLCYHDLAPDSARVLLESHRPRIEALAPAWIVRAAELWEPDGGSWRLRARAELR
jgi:2'-5' RNA ligase